MMSQHRIPKQKAYLLYAEKLISFLLVLLWSYTSSDKLLYHEEFVRQLSSQSLPAEIIPALSYLIPVSEVLLALLIVLKSTRHLGMVLSMALLLVFTIYVALAVLGLREKMPCACGGIISGMGWMAHLLLNIFFLSLSAIGIRFNKKKGGSLTGI